MGAVAEKCDKDKLKNESDIHMCRAYVGGAFIGFFELLVGAIIIAIIYLSYHYDAKFKDFIGRPAFTEGWMWWTLVLVIILIFSGGWLTGISFAGQSYLPQTPVA